MMTDLWPDIKSSARAFVLAWALILTPIMVTATFIQVTSPQQIDG